MNILTLSNYYPEHAGGIEFVALNLVQRWRRCHTVRWMACDVAGYPHHTVRDDVPLPTLNFAEECLGFPYPLPLGRSVFEIFEQVKWCDVVHVHDCLYLANHFAFLASRWYRKPLLVTQHVALVSYSQAYKNTLQKLAYHTLGRLVLRNAEGVIFISKRVEDWFAARMRFRHSTALIPNGVDHSLFYSSTPDERENARAQLGFSADVVVLLFVGRFTQKKGVHLLREMAVARPRYRWLMVGRGEMDPREWNLPNVKVIPPQPQAALRLYYIAADLFVLPSVGEGFPLAVQESLSCGLPAAVSSETAAYLPDAPLAILDVFDPCAMLQTLDNLFTARECLAALRDAAGEYAGRWDWETVAKEYEKILVRLL